MRCAGALRARTCLLTEGNTLLSDKKLEKLVILRMNRRFMEFMRQSYKHLIKNKLDKQFGASLSVLSPEDASS